MRSRSKKLKSLGELTLEYRSDFALHSLDDSLRQIFNIEHTG